KIDRLHALGRRRRTRRGWDLCRKQELEGAGRPLIPGHPNGPARIEIINTIVVLEIPVADADGLLVHLENGEIEIRTLVDTLRHREIPSGAPLGQGGDAPARLVRGTAQVREVPIERGRRSFLPRDVVRTVVSSKAGDTPAIVGEPVVHRVA